MTTFRIFQFNHNPQLSALDSRWKSYWFIYFWMKTYSNKNPMQCIGFCNFEQKSDVVHQIVIFFNLGKKGFSYQRESNTVHQILVENPSDSRLKSWIFNWNQMHYASISRRKSSKFNSIALVFYVVRHPFWVVFTKLFPKKYLFYGFQWVWWKNINL